ncbi:MAG: phospho-sugar mutase, partial [Eubacterium sp.]|nr:phospho-sugar mutase [Candidatus Colimonas fimequi]
MTIDYRQVHSDWLVNCTAYKAELLTMKDEEIADAFGKDLKFGTAGLRGVMGAGTNRMNEFVVRRATQGLSDHLNANYENPTVAIAYDSRNNSREFAIESARVLAGNGIKTYIYEELMPVPVLSFTVRRLETTCGIVITASHNSREYNGYKVYGSDGGQILDSEANSILECIGKVDMFKDVKTAPFEPSPEGLISFVDQSIYEEYMQAMLDATNIGDNTDIDILYTPLNGSGLKPVTDMFTRCGFDVRIVPEQKDPNGDFPTCTYPNPEKPETYTVALSQANGCDLIVATDPDCDRCGCMVKHNGEYVLFSGNEIGTVFAYYMCSLEGAAGKTIVTSIVSTPIIEAIAAAAEANVRRTLVGFKYIGEQMNDLGDKFMFGFEESNGYLTGLYARDKDGVCGARLLCVLAAAYKAQGKTLVDVLNEIYDKFGTCVNKTVSLETEGGPLMAKVRAAGIDGAIDYSGGINGLPKADVIQINYADGSRMIIRPSGTEPKVKLYVSAPTQERVD